MATKGKFELVILWESEVRAAAKAMVELVRIFDSGTATEAERGEALFTAFGACSAALSGADNDHACLVISRPPPFGFQGSVKKTDEANERK